MTYDAVLVARRGLGVDDLRLASPVFLDAVRWAVFAEKIAQPLDDLEAMAGRDATGVKGPDLATFMKQRTAARDELKRRRVLLLLEEPGPPPRAADG